MRCSWGIWRLSTIFWVRRTCWSARLTTSRSRLMAASVVQKPEGCRFLTRSAVTPKGAHQSICFDSDCRLSAEMDLTRTVVSCRCAEEKELSASTSLREISSTTSGVAAIRHSCSRCKLILGLENSTTNGANGSFTLVAGAEAEVAGVKAEEVDEEDGS